MVWEWPAWHYLFFPPTCLKIPNDLEVSTSQMAERAFPTTWDKFRLYHFLSICKTPESLSGFHRYSLVPGKVKTWQDKRLKLIFIANNWDWHTFKPIGISSGSQCPDACDIPGSDSRGHRPWGLPWCERLTLWCADARRLASGIEKNHRKPRITLWLWLQSHGKSPFLIGKPSIAMGHFPWLC